MISIEERQAYEVIIAELRAIRKEVEELNKKLGDDDED